jgi:hypothetical protein
MMYLERIELEIAVTLCPGIYAAELEFYDVNGTNSNGPYHPDSRIKFHAYEFVDGVSWPTTVRYPFTARLPSQLFTYLEPDASRYIEIHARAWFGSKLFPDPFPLSCDGALPKLILSNAEEPPVVCIGSSLEPYTMTLPGCNFHEPFSRIPFLSPNPHYLATLPDALNW